MPYIEIGYGIYMTICIILCLRQHSVLSFSLPFLIIFAVGYYYVGILSLYTAWSSARKLPPRCSISPSSAA